MNPYIARLAHREIEGPITVGRIRSGITHLVGASSPWVWLSADTLRKQLAHHPDFKLDFYENLEWLLLHGEALADRRERCLNIVKQELDGQESRIFKATVKSVRTSGYIMLLSVHRIRGGDYKRLINRSKK